MRKQIVLISKEVVLPEYFEVYGGKYWKTPNINELAKKGTIFNRHYTSAPSTAMAFTAMLTGVEPYLTNRSDYTQVEEFKQTKNIFNLFEEIGYKTHVLWSTNYKDIRFKYTRCYGENTVFHDQVKFNQSVGVHIPFKDAKLERSDETLDKTYKYILSVIDEACKDEKMYMWIHLPHVLEGRIGYGDDIDYVDKIVGYLREKVGDESIYVSADHGHLNLSKGKSTYGFDVYEKAIRIPLITPRIGGLTEVDFPTSNSQLIDIIFRNKLEKREIVISDSAYYAQPFRKIALIKGKYKLIYNKLKGNFEFYDVVWDPVEENNILEELKIDKDRQRKVVRDQIYFYPFKEEALESYQVLLKKFNEIWKTASFYTEKKNFIIRKLKNFKAKLRRLGLVK